MALNDGIHNIKIKHDDIDGFPIENNSEIITSKQMVIKEEKIDEYDSADNFQEFPKIKTEQEDENLLEMNCESTIKKKDNMYLEQSSVCVNHEYINLKHEEINLKYEKIDVNIKEEKDGLDPSNLNPHVKEIKATTKVKDYNKAGNSTFEFVDVSAVNEDGIFFEQHQSQCNNNTREQLTEPCRNEYSIPIKDGSSKLMLEKKWECDICNAIFTSRRNLSRHKQFHTNIGCHTCEVCSKKFTAPSALAMHVLIHTGEKPHKCTQCDQAFNQVAHLTDHMRIHTGEKPHKCKLCEKAFNRSGVLKRHMSIHTGEKPHKCTQCEKSFSQAGDLNDHMRLHTGEKPNKCKQCEKSFNRAGVLKRHMIIHTGEKPYKCSLCEKAFRQAAHLKRHTAIHSRERPYKRKQ